MTNFSKILTMAVVLAAVSIPVFAESGRMRADVPFPFQAGDKVLPAGIYDVQVALADHRIVVRQVNGNQVVSLSTGAATDPMGQGSALVFQRYGSSYFLRQVDTGADGYKMPKSKTEREVASTVTSVQLAFVPTWSR
jgi:hypothetical protein